MDNTNVLLLTSDHEYVRHVRAHMAKHHSDLKLQHIASPTELPYALAAFSANALIIGMEFAAAPLSVPESLAVAYFADNNSVHEHKGRPVFCKYRNADALYNFMTGVSGKPLKCPRISAFFGAGGGTGSTTVSAAYARKLASEKKNVLYISLDRYADLLVWFGCKGTVLTELAKQNASGAAIMSAAGTDPSTGVRFIGCCTEPSEYRMMNPAAFKAALAAIMAASAADEAVLDGDATDPLYREFFDSYADTLYVVTQDDPCNLSKLKRTLEELERDSRKPLKNIKGTAKQRTAIIVNRCSADSSTPENVNAAGALPVFGGNNAGEIALAMSKLDALKARS